MSGTSPGPEMSLEEAQKVVEGKVYPRVTKEGMEAKIHSVEYFCPESVPNLTVCIITMQNRFFVLGKSVPADARNFDPEVGKRYAYEDAFKQIWPLEAYLLKERMHMHEGR